MADHGLCHNAAHVGTRSRSILSQTVAQPVPLQITDADILNFALNLEYLEGEFYACATSGSGLPANLRGGGPASIGCQIANLTGSVAVSAAGQSLCQCVTAVCLRAGQVPGVLKLYTHVVRRQP